MKFNLKKAFIVSIIVGTLISCGEKKELAPAISQEKMQLVLRDIHLAEAGLQNYMPEEKDSIANIYYYHIFKLHNVKEEDFYNSFDYYAAQPEVMYNIYQGAIDSIKTLKIQQK